MDLFSIMLYFLAGGLTVSAGVLLANSGNSSLSGLALMFPSVTAVSLYFIGKSMGSQVATASIKSTIATAIIAWLPYMLVMLYLTPKMGLNKAMFFGILTFLIIGAVWITVNSKYKFI